MYTNWYSHNTGTYYMCERTNSSGYFVNTANYLHDTNSQLVFRHFTRHIPARTYVCTQYIGRVRRSHLLCERFAYKCLASSCDARLSHVRIIYQLTNWIFRAKVNIHQVSLQYMHCCVVLCVCMYVGFDLGDCFAGRPRVGKLKSARLLKSWWNFSNFILVF